MDKHKIDTETDFLQSTLPKCRNLSLPSSASIIDSARLS